MGASLGVGLKSGDAVGPYRVTSELWRWPEYRFYRAVSAGHDKPFLLREFRPQEQDPARLKRLRARERERFALVRGALRRVSPHHLTFADYVDQDGGFAVFAHRDLDRLSANAAGLEVRDEPTLLSLVTPVFAVLRELHAREIICVTLRAEEILTDPGGLTAPVFAGLQHAYHLRGVGPKRPEPIAGYKFAPEFSERQKPPTFAADVYVLAALMFSLLGLGDVDLADERAIEMALLAADPKCCPVRLQNALIAGLKLDPAARPQSIAEFEDLAFGEIVKNPSFGFPLPVRRISALLLPPRSETPMPKAEVTPASAAGPDAVPPWPALRAMLDGQVPVQEGAMRAAEEAQENLPSPSELEVAAQGLAAALRECVLAPWKLACSMTAEGIAFARKAPNLAARAVARARAFASAKWPEPAIAAAAIVVAVCIAAEIASLKPSLHAHSRITAALAAPMTARLASSDDLVRVPNEKREELAVQDEVLSALAARALQPQMLTIAGGPTMIALPAPRPAQSEADEATALTPQGDPSLATIQTELRRLGLYRGRVDGVMGVRTRGAIIGAQEALGQPPTGEPDPQLLAGLKTLAPYQVASASMPSSQRSLQRDDTRNVAARAITRPLPDFPNDAFQQRVEGWIEVAYDVDPRGNVQHARVTGFKDGRALEAFQRQALAAIDQAMYAPARKNGKPVWSRGLRVRYQFNVVRHGWGPFRSREPRSSIVADSSGPISSTLQ